MSTYWEWFAGCATCYSMVCSSAMLELAAWAPLVCLGIVRRQRDVLFHGFLNGSLCPLAAYRTRSPVLTAVLDATGRRLAAATALAPSRQDPLQQLG